MSTHFSPRPQPPPTPTSPVRPSTAHSTIRAVTPSPPGSDHDTFKPNFPLPRPKSEHALGSPEMAMYARYVMQAENGGSGTSPAARGDCLGLRRGGATSGRSSPVKSRAKSPRKRPVSTPPGLSACVKVTARDVEAEEEEGEKWQKQEPLIKEQEHSIVTAEHEQEPSTATSPTLEEETQDSDSDASAPDTPTPMTRAQKRQAYTPLRLPTSLPKDDLSFLPPSPPTLVPAVPPSLSPTSHTMPRKPMNSAFSPTNRMSTSGASHTTFLSSASKNSVFSTPGRDELERKKPLVEMDEGPFARAQSMMDLGKERKRMTSGAEADEHVEKKRGWGKLRCGACVVM